MDPQEHCADPWSPRTGAEPSPQHDPSSTDRSDSRGRPPPVCRRGQRPPGSRRLCSATSSTNCSSLFGVDEAGLWMYDGSPTPLKLAAQRGSVAGRPRDHRDAARVTRRRPAWRRCAATRSGSCAATSARPCPPSRRSTSGPASGRSASSRSSSTTSRSASWPSTTTAITPGPTTRPSSPGHSPTTWRRPSATPGWPARRERSRPACR